MFNLIKSGVKIKLAEECIKGVGNAVSKVAKGVANTMKDPHARKAVGVIVGGLCIGLIASAYV